MKKNLINSKFWIIPKEIYEPLNKEFNFDFDPCPFPFVKDGIEVEWGNVNWVNPPFRARDAINSHGPTAFVRKAIAEQEKGKSSVLILPLDNWVKLLLDAKAEIRVVGSHEWIHTKDGSRRKAPRPSFLFILKGKKK